MIQNIVYYIRLVYFDWILDLGCTYRYPGACIRFAWVLVYVVLFFYSTCYIMFVWCKTVVIAELTASSVFHNDTLTADEVIHHLISLKWRIFRSNSIVAPIINFQRYRGLWDTCMQLALARHTQGTSCAPGPLQQFITFKGLKRPEM